MKLPKYFPFTNIELGDIKILSFRNPKKGDIIAFYLNDYKNLNSIIFVKRCVGEPGDSITIDNKNIYLPKQGDKIILNKNNINELKPLLIKDGCIVDTQYDSLIIVNGQVVSSYEFKNDYYFFVGDNFTKSFDSRNFGPIPRKDIIGKIVLVFWSINNENIVKNYFSTVRWNRLGMV
ncbi:MAG: signal peptidase I, partial [bacterium]|nr:signal peptidase I [bacterium]